MKLTKEEELIVRAKMWDRVLPTEIAQAFRDYRDTIDARETEFAAQVELKDNLIGDANFKINQLQAELTTERVSAAVMLELAAEKCREARGSMLDPNDTWQDGFRQGTESAYTFVRALIPTDHAAALAEHDRKEREDEHVKLCPKCSIFPSEKSGCERLAQLRSGEK